MTAANSNIVEVNLTPAPTASMIAETPPPPYTQSGVIGAVAASPNTLDLSYTYPFGQFVPTDSLVNGYQLLTCYFQPSDLFIIGLNAGYETPAPESAEFTVSFTDDNGAVFTFSNTNASSYFTESYQGIWFFDLTPPYPALTLGKTYSLSGGGGTAVTAPVLNLELDEHAIVLTWSCATTGITEFVLYKNLSGAGWLPFATLGGSVLEFQDEITYDPVLGVQVSEYYLIAKVSTSFSGPSNLVTTELAP